jgi:alpha-amylase
MLSKPPLLTLLTNVGANASTGVAWRIPAGVYAPGTKLVDVLSCTPLTVNTINSTGRDTDVTAQGRMPQVLLPASALSSRGGMCACLALATGGAGRVRGRVVTARALAVVGTALVMGVVALLEVDVDLWRGGSADAGLGGVG